MSTERHPNRQGKEKRKKNKHHIKNKCNGGPTRPENLCDLKIEKHDFLHFIFKNMDYLEIAILLLRVCRAKHYERIDPRIKKFYELL